MKLVFDTNVLIAALIGKGACYNLFERCLCVHSPVTSEFILNEVREKLREKFKYSDNDALVVVTLLRSRMEVVDPLVLPSQICRDPDDDMILATALAGDAVCIITGDKDLLILKHFGSIEILSPSEFIDYEEGSFKS